MSDLLIWIVMNQYIVKDIRCFFDIKKIFWHPGFVDDYLRLFGIGEGAGGKGTSKEAERLAYMIRIYILNEPDLQKIEQLPLEFHEEISDFKIVRESNVNGGGIYRMMGFLMLKIKSLGSSGFKLSSFF